MPRADMTFSDRDLIRVWTRHLTKDEQENVRCFFLVAEIAKENEKRGATLILKIAILFLKNIPGFSLLLELFLEAKEVFDTLSTKKECLDRLKGLVPP